MSKRRVVVTGYGMVTPLGPDAETTFSQAARGRSGINVLTHFDPRGLPCQIGGEVPDGWFDDASGLPAGHSARLWPRGLRLMLAAAREATGRSRSAGAIPPGRFAVVVGSHGENPCLRDVELLHRFTDGQGRWDLEGLRAAAGYDFLQFHRRKPDVAPALLAAWLGAEGPNLSLVSACAAGTQAIGEAYRLIQEGRCDAALAGGCESTLNFVGFVGFVLLKAMAEKYASPKSASRPFDRKRGGFVMSEGAGALVLEELDHALARKAPIQGEILGYGDSADAYRVTDTHPTGAGAVLAMRAALADAGLTPDRVEYVNAHGTSTLQNDLTETRAIKEVLGERAWQVPVSSNKSMLGHAIAAAGAIEAALSFMGMQRSLLLPTINYQFPDPKCDLDYVPNEARPVDHRVVLSNSFGFGGQNGCLCLGRWDG